MAGEFYYGLGGINTSVFCTGNYLREIHRSLGPAAKGRADPAGLEDGLCVLRCGEPWLGLLTTESFAQLSSIPSLEILSLLNAQPLHLEKMI